MTINEIKAMYSNEYTDIEVCVFTSNRHQFHTDCIEFIDEYTDDSIVEAWSLMDENEYNSTILANSCESADFGMWYDDASAKVLVIAIK